MEPEELLLTEFLKAHPDDAAQLVEQLPAAEVAALLAEIQPESAAAVFGRMASVAATEILALLPAAAAGAILAGLSLETAALLLRRMDPERRPSVLRELPEDVRGRVSRLLQYPEGTAGAFMDPAVETLPQDMSVNEALRFLREHPQDVYYYVYIVDREQRLEGVLDVRELLQADGDDSLRSVMRRHPLALPARADLPSILAHPAWTELDALPVIDGQGVLLGVIRHRRMRSLQSELAVKDRDQSGLAVLLAFGELYWAGLRGLLQGAALAASPKPAPPTGATKETTHE